jgi:nitroreductase
VELREAAARRRMVRSFLDRPVPPPVLDRVLRTALSGPSAGFTQGLELVVLAGATEVARFWDATLPAERRAAFPWPGLLAAPVIVVPLADPAAYVARYAEADKARTGLGEGEAAWPVPYWIVDTAFAAMLALLAAVDEDLGALFFGIFHGEAELLAALRVPDGYRPIGAIAVGYPAPGGDRPSRSVAQRGRRPLDTVVHRGSW